MNRSDLIERLVETKGINLREAEQIIVEIFDSMSDTLVAGDRIEVRNFGNFEIREYDGYTGRNPMTGEEITVTPKKTPFFKVGKELKERIMDSGS